MTDDRKRLYKSRDRRVFGILGGLADYFGLDPSLVRIVYVLMTVFTLGLPGIGLYFLMAIIVPRAPKPA
ncbi:MAG: PspC domain-containing protein [Chloroflexi bacterium]|nr:PspC domain-containing protein [Chloroflexota bacterium]